MLALYAAGVFPANTKHAVYNVQFNSIANELVVPSAPVGSSPSRHMVGALFCAGRELAVLSPPRTI
jgi:hypothetical protein